MFGYQCQECGKGTVVDQVFPKYNIKVHGKPALAENAHVGICDYCRAEHFDPTEVLRWRNLHTSVERHDASPIHDHDLASWENEGGQ